MSNMVRIPEQIDVYIHTHQLEAPRTEANSKVAAAPKKPSQNLAKKVAAHRKKIAITESKCSSKLRHCEYLLSKSKKAHKQKNVSVSAESSIGKNHDMLMQSLQSKNVNRFYTKMAVGYAFHSNFKKVGWEADNQYINEYIKNAKALGTAVCRIELGKQVSKNLSFGFSASYNQRELKSMTIYSNVVGEIQPGTYTFVTMPIRSLSGMFNAYYGYDRLSHFKPYIMAGIGVTRNTTKGYNHIIDTSQANINLMVKEMSKNSFSWNLGCGMLIKFNDNLDLDLGFQYIDLGSASTTNQATIVYPGKIFHKNDDKYAANVKLGSYVTSIGFRYNF